MGLLSSFTYRCARCGTPLTAQVVSIVTEEAICMGCDEKESQLIARARRGMEAGKTRGTALMLRPALAVVEAVTSGAAALSDQPRS